MIIRKPPGKQLAGLLLALMLLLPLVPAAGMTAQAASNTPVPNGISIADGAGSSVGLNDERGYYLVNGKPSKTGTLGSGGCTAYYDRSTGTLWLNNFDGGTICTYGGNDKKLTVALIGTNRASRLINGDGNGCSFEITSAVNGKLIIQCTGEDESLAGINTGRGGSYTKGSVVLSGSADVSVTLTHTKDVTSYATDARAIYANEGIEIRDSASYTAKLNTRTKNPNNASGLFNYSLGSGSKIVINTAGNVTIDTSGDTGLYNAPIYNAVAYATELIKVGQMTLTYKAYGGLEKDSNSGTNYDEEHFIKRSVTDNSVTTTTYTYAPEGVVNITVADGQYRSDTGYYGSNTVTTRYAKSSAQTVQLTAPANTKGFPFQRWYVAAGNAQVVGSLRDDPISVYPDNDLTMLALYNVFETQPQVSVTYDESNARYINTVRWKITDDLQPTTTYLVPEAYQLNKYLSPIPVNNSDGLPLAGLYSGYCFANTGSDPYGGTRIPESGSYKIAVQIDGIWYYSEPFYLCFDYPQKVKLTIDGEPPENWASPLKYWDTLEVVATPDASDPDVKIYYTIATDDYADPQATSARTETADGKIIVDSSKAAAGEHVYISAQAMRVKNGTELWGPPVHLPAYRVQESELPEFFLEVTADGKKVSDFSSDIRFVEVVSVKAKLYDYPIAGLVLGLHQSGKSYEMPTVGSVGFYETAGIQVGLMSKWGSGTLGTAVNLKLRKVQVYTVSITDGEVWIDNVKQTPNASGQYPVPAGATVGIQSVKPESGTLDFSYWETVGVTLYNDRSSWCVFTMPEGNVTIRAVFPSSEQKALVSNFGYYPTAAKLDKVIQKRENAAFSKIKISSQWYVGDTATGTPLTNLTMDRTLNYTGLITITPENDKMTFAPGVENDLKIFPGGGTQNAAEIAGANVKRVDDRHITITFHLINRPTVTLNHFYGEAYSTSSTAVTGHEGYKVTRLDYESGSTGKITTAADSMTISKLELTCTDGAYLLPVSRVWVNGQAVAVDNKTVMQTNDANGNTLAARASFTLPLSAKPTGVTVSGQVASYNPKNAVTIRLMQGDTEKYQTTIAATTGSGQVTQNFSFTSVAAGTYDLVVKKDAHLTYTIKNVAVGSTDVDLAAITLLCGDLNGDGFINSTDLGIVLQGQNYGKTVGVEGVNQLTDLNGDGWVNSTDLGIILQGQHYGKSAISVDYSGATF